LSDILAILAFLIDPFTKIWTKFREFQEKREVKEKLFRALSAEIETYVNTFKDMEKIGRERMLPILQSIASTHSRDKINQIIDCVIEVQKKYAQLIESFVKIAKGCKDVSSYEAFMEHLKKADYILFDFVNVMAGTVEDDTVVIDSRFYRFIKMHENKITKGFAKELKNEVIENVVKEVKFYVDVTNKHVKPYINESIITRKTRMRFNKSHKELSAASRKIRVEKTEIIDLRQYVPSELLPIVLLIEEILP